MKYPDEKGAAIKPWEAVPHTPSQGYAGKTLADKGQEWVNDQALAIDSAQAREQAELNAHASPWGLGGKREDANDPYHTTILQIARAPQRP